MERFTLRKNDYLSRHTLGYFHQLYLGYQNLEIQIFEYTKKYAKPL